MGQARVPDVNDFKLAGRVTWGPDFKKFGDDNSVCKFGLVYNRKYRKKGGEQGEDSLFITCEVWGKPAEWANKDLFKGKKIIATGSLKQREWEKDGVKHSVFEFKVDKIDQLEWDDEEDSGQGAPADESVY